MLYNQLQFAIAAFVFYTRLPFSNFVSREAYDLNRASVYLPLVGILVAFISWSAFEVFSSVFSQSLSVLFSMVASLLMTGAIHEDGLADFFDGIGGGSSRERILAIMKDSRIGTFGAASLIIVFAMKFIALSELPSAKMWKSLLIGHSGSRFVAISFAYTHSYVRTSSDSKFKLEIRKMSFSELIFSGMFGCLPLLLLELRSSLHLICFLFLLRQLLGIYLSKKIGGYTGDCLGAAQQLSECVIYLFLLGFTWKST
jgi:adenosylcobinamide-GDP ribazoletransferase